ncbi:MAG: AsmA family protein [Pseudomonadota bacterium]
MKKILKPIAILLATLLLIVLAAVGYLLFIFDANQFKSQITQVVKEKQQRTLSIDGALKLTFYPNLGVDLGKTSLSARNSEVVFARLDSAHVSLALMPLLKKELVVDRIELTGLDLTLSRDKDGKTNIDDLLPKAKDNAQPAADTDSGTLKFDVKGLALKHANLHLFGADNKPIAALKNIDLDTGRIADKVSTQLDLSGELEAPAKKLRATFKLNGKLRFDLKAQTVAAEKLAISSKISKATQLWEISLSSPLQANLLTKQLTLAALSIDAKLANAATPQKVLTIPLRGNLQADLGKENISGKLTSSFDESHIESSFSVTKFSPMAIKFDIGIDRINLDRYLSPKTTAASASAAATPAAKSEAKPEAPLNFSALKTLTLDGNLRIGALQVQNIKATSVSTRLRNTQGKLEIAPLAAQLYGGSLSGGIGVNANDNSVSLRPQLSNININPLLKDALNHDNLEGRGNLTLNLTMAGNTPTAFKRNLNGTIALALQDGAVKGINLAKAFRNFNAALGRNQDQKMVADSSEKTDFSALTASMRFANGVGSSDDLALKSPFLRVGGDGTVNVAHDTLDYIARVTVVNSATGQGGIDLGQLKNLTVPVRISGPLEQPAFEIVYSEVAQDVLKSVIANKLGLNTPEKKEEAKKEAVDQLQNKLKDLLKF